MLVMPTLVFVLSTSASIHLINYYRDAARRVTGPAAAQRAVRWAWQPCWYAAITTAIGLVSLGISQVRPVQTFGFYTAAGVLGSLVWMFLVLPGFLDRWPPRRPAPSSTGRLDWLALSGLVTRYRWWILVLAALTTAALAIGLLRVKTSVRVGDLFAPRTRIIRDYGWLEERFGPLVPIEVVVRFEASGSWTLLEQLEAVGDLATAIDAMPESGGTMSAASFFPRLDREGGGRQIARRTAFNRTLERDQEMLVETGYFQAAAGGTAWRIRTQIPALGSMDCDTFISAVQAHASPLLASYEEGEKTQPALDFTGLPLLTDAVQQKLLEDLFNSYLMAFLVITLVISVVQKSVTMGAIAMIPNVFPTLTVFGVMGWLGQPIEVGAMVTASVALGIAVDDTLHFMTCYQRAGRSSQALGDAVAAAYRKCGTAMVQTTLICGLALLPHAASSCVPVSRFAWLMLSLLAAALLGDLLLLPALLLVTRQNNSRQGAAEGEADPGAEAGATDAHT
jgi:predicted RND superfamily exporter protein